MITRSSADTYRMGSRNPFNGEIEGFDIDQLHRVSQAIFGDPDRIEFKIVTYAQRIPNLVEGNVDIVAHSMTINCARWEQINFSSEYYTAGQKETNRRAGNGPAGGICNAADQGRRAAWRRQDEGEQCHEEGLHLRRFSWVWVAS